VQAKGWSYTWIGRMGRRSDKWTSNVNERRLVRIIKSAEDNKMCAPPSGGKKEGKIKEDLAQPMFRHFSVFLVQFFL